MQHSVSADEQVHLDAYDKQQQSDQESMQGRPKVCTDVHKQGNNATASNAFASLYQQTLVVYDCVGWPNNHRLLHSD